MLERRPTAGRRDAESSVRVVSYNIHAERKGWGDDKFQTVEVACELDAFAADVYVLCETWARGRSDELVGSVRSWCDANGLNHVSGISMEPPHLDEDENTIRTLIATKHRIVDTALIDVRRWRRDYSVRRQYPAALVELPDGTRFWQVGVHASSRVPDAPISNLLCLRRGLRKLSASPWPVVVAGDFNLWGWWVRIVLRGRFRRAVRGRTWPALRPHSQIDHILVPPAVGVSHSGVAPCGFSDHRAIWADVSLPHRTSGTDN